MSSTPPLSSQRFEAVEEHVRDLVGQGVLPHAQFLAARDGEILHDFCIGEARADGRPLRPDALYRIASMTKAITAVLFMMLVEEHRVALDDPVASILPELSSLSVHAAGSFPPFETRPAMRQPRMIDLLTHVSGFTYGFQPHSAVAQAYWKAGIHNFRATITRDGMLADLATMPLVHDPGAHFTYSIATDLLGIIAERLMDQSLSELFRTRIFAPLGMEDTCFSLRPDDAGRLTDAWACHPRQGRYIYDEAAASLWSRPVTFESGGGGLLSTMADYHRFCRMLLNGGALDGERLIAAETLSLMTRNHLPHGRSIGEMSISKFAGPDYLGTGHGLGLAVTLPNGLSPRPAGEYHWSGLFSTWYSVIPSERLILILMTQILPLTEDRLPDEVHRILFA